MMPVCSECNAPLFSDFYRGLGVCPECNGDCEDGAVDLEDRLQQAME